MSLLFAVSLSVVHFLLHITMRPHVPITLRSRPTTVDDQEDNHHVVKLQLMIGVSVENEVFFFLVLHGGRADLKWYRNQQTTGRLYG